MLLLVAFVLSLTNVAGAARILVPVDGAAMEGELMSVDAAGNLAVRSAADADRRITLPFERLVRWGNPVESRPQIIILLSDGGRLTTAAAWAGGAPVRLEGSSFVVLMDAWGEVSLPRPLVRGVVFAQRSHPRERERLEEAVRQDYAADDRAGISDVISLTNKDQVLGELRELSGGSLELLTKAGAVKLPLSRVEAIALGGSRRPSAVGRQPSMVVGTTDGSLLNATRLIADEKTLSVDLAGGVTLAGGNVNDLVFVQSLGGRFVYLSDLEPASYRHVPYFSLEWPLRRDRNALGEPLTVQGRRYWKGLGMHSASRVTYALGGQYRRFDAAVAIDDSAGKKGSVTFGVYVQRDGQWQAAYTSEVTRGGKAPRPVSVDLSGAQGLTLTVDFADRGDELDRANWLDARLVR